MILESRLCVVFSVCCCLQSGLVVMQIFFQEEKKGKKKMNENRNENEFKSKILKIVKKKEHYIKLEGK